jgi:glutamate formiminotransferase / 5-formyltetrahydrofolate cyclo-ligase
VLLAVPNLSEGRSPEAIDAIGRALSQRLELLDLHSDPIHNRSVFTLAGAPGALAEGLVGGARAGIEAIDMSRHQGAHPCVGALDVCPVVYAAAGDREAAARDALDVADAIGSELEVPVFLYGELATAPQRRERAYFRRGGLPELTRRMQVGELEPDRGPREPHPTAGATLVTARPPLAAFNVELDTADREVAAAVAVELREAGGGLPGVRAIGVELPGERSQVSTNVHDPVAVPLARVVAEIERLAGPHGTRPVAAELVGLVPAAAMAGYPEDVPVAGFDPDRHLIERRLARLDDGT